MNTPSLSDRLREAAKGQYFWRVQDKTTKAWCMEFTDYEKPEAEEWWKINRKQHPDYHANNELVRVHYLSPTDRLMIEAAKALDRKTKGKK